MFQEWRGQTLPGILRYSAQHWPDKVAISFANESITYRAFEQRVQSVGRALQAAGVQRGDHVACLMSSSPRWLEIFFAVIGLGARLVPLNLTWTEGEIIQGLNLTDCHILLVGPDYKGEPLLPRISGLFEDEVAPPVPTLRKILLAEGLSVGSQAVEALDSYIEAATCKTDVPSLLPARADDVAMMILTSGSTSFPKPAMHTHESVLCGAAHFADGLEAREDDVFLHCMPNYHVGSIATACLALMRGARLELMSVFEPGAALHLIDTKQATLFWGFDVHFLMMRDHPEYEPSRLSSLRSTMVAANPATYEKVRAMGIGHIGSLYGSTEYMGSQAYFPYRDRFDADRMKLSNGRPTSGEIRIATDGGEWAQPGELGEICVRGPALFQSYYRQPDATAECMDDEGFFHSGDLGFLDEDGYLYYRGRLKEMIKSGGENVSALEVETFLLSEIKGVKRAMICATPHDKWGEAVTALLDIDDAVSYSEQDIREYCRGKLAGSKIPKRVLVIPSREGPITPTGKVDRKVLAARAPRHFQPGHA